MSRQYIVASGTGKYSNKIGVIQYPEHLKINQDGIAIGVIGINKPIDWSEQVVLKMEDGSYVCFHKSRVFKQEIKKAPSVVNHVVFKNIVEDEDEDEDIAF